jgi:Fur family transcriptional regulator, peroxide stress response regulator
MILNKNHVQTVAAVPPAEARGPAGARWTPLRGLLRARGGRLTPQRMAIYEAVVGHTTHPSVEMVHAAVRARFPGVSRATVYATLDLFADLGLVQEVGGRVRRYDGRAGRHVNLVCERCGGVTDIADPRLEALERRTAVRAGFDVRSARFELHGVCPRCRAQSRRAGGRSGTKASGGRRTEGARDA